MHDNGINEWWCMSVVDDDGGSGRITLNQVWGLMQKNTGFRCVVSLPCEPDDLFVCSLAFSATCTTCILAIYPDWSIISQWGAQTSDLTGSVRPENQVAFFNRSRGAWRGPPMPRIWRQVGARRQSREPGPPGPRNSTTGPACPKRREARAMLTWGWKRRSREAQRSWRVWVKMQ